MKPSPPALRIGTKHLPVPDPPLSGHHHRVNMVAAPVQDHLFQEILDRGGSGTPAVCQLQVGRPARLEAAPAAAAACGSLATAAAPPLPPTYLILMLNAK